MTHQLAVIRQDRLELLASPPEFLLGGFQTNRKNGVASDRKRMWLDL